MFLEKTRNDFENLANIVITVRTMTGVMLLLNVA
eukprot:SAG31_NODE_26390_length_443_cov_0.904070_1_plen_33_part_01